MHTFNLLLTLTTILPLTLSASTPNTNTKSDPAIIPRAAEAVAEPVQLEKRACKCRKVKNEGLYCGYCYLTNIDDEAVYEGDIWDNVYWCNKKGGCEDLGRRTSCVKRDGPCDGRDKK
ncbi:hypothetical protein B0J11DRAFT_516910 [Dendryphion nanum]|uniref:Uncharacterized protein n=1 Tax=Dendryphion nanum TaxID=256645 RepID=A0A9P9IZD9_9PLEO|nr:hypothetical protein B0J11DRAFT_516910 [Dendryphion nanum]